MNIYINMQDSAGNGYKRSAVPSRQKMVAVKKLVFWGFLQIEKLNGCKFLDEDLHSFLRSEYY